MSKTPKVITVTPEQHKKLKLICYSRDLKLNELVGQMIDKEWTEFRSKKGSKSNGEAKEQSAGTGQ